jgi:type I restriction enzyme S subunit
MSEVAEQATLPNGWEAIPLGDVIKLEYGKSLTVKNRDETGDVPVYGSSGDVGCHNEPYVKEPCLIVGRKGNVGSVFISHKPCWPIDTVYYVVPPEGLDIKYLYYQLGHLNLYHLDKSTAIPGLNRNDAYKVTFKLAPLEQQKRIVAKIEELFSQIDAGIEALKKAKHLLKRYRQSILKAAVTGELTKEWRDANKDTIESVEALLEKTEKPPKPNRWKTRSKEVLIGHPALTVGNPESPLPEGWKWVPLVEIAKMESGHTPSRRHPEWWDGDIPWIGIVDAREHHCGVINDTIQHTNEEGLANSASRLLPKGTVCVSRTASVGYVVTMGRNMATSQDFVNWVPTQGNRSMKLLNCWEKCY